ncbi:MAG: ComF family protein [Clostridia bacterium]
MKQNKLIRIIFPKKCPNCRQIIPLNRAVCNCQDDAVEIVKDPSCEHCACSKDRCTCEVKNNVKLEHIAAVYLYNGFIKDQIQEFKFRGKLSLTKHFARLMSERVQERFSGVQFDFVTFVPMSKLDFYERGYNQSKLLTQKISQNLKVPFAQLLTKPAQTKKQHKQTASERRENLKTAFKLADVDVKDKTILICDDIKTTGSTLQNCAEILLENGAKDVYCICIAVSDYYNQ